MKHNLQPFDHVFKDNTSGNRKFLSSEYKPSGLLAIVDQGQNEIAGFTDDIDSACKIKLPCVLFGDHTKKIQYQEMPFALGADGVKALEVAEGVEPKYAYYALSRFRFPDGTGYSRHFKFLKKAVIPLPPLDEQRRIASILDKADAIRRKRQEALKLADDLVKSQFIEMFGDPVTNPKGWEIKPVAKVITHANNGMSRRGHDENGDIVLRLVELQGGYIDYANPNRITLTEAEKKRYLLVDGDFLFARVNGNPENVGRCAVFEGLTEDVYHNDHIIRVRFDADQINGWYANALLNGPYGKAEMKDKIKTSAGQYTINQEGIGSVNIPLPPLPLQNEFAAFVEQADKSKFIMQQQLSEIEALSSALKQEYFAKTAIDT